MKAVAMTNYGSADVLEYTEVEKPQIKPNQMLVKVHASSINPIDWKIRKGMLKILTGKQFPMVLGFDVSGEVVEVGNQVIQFKPGDLVYARINQRTGGTYAEYVAVDEKMAAYKPQNMSHEEAAAVPLAAMTALQALRDKGNIQNGQKVLINGASGGVGTYAVQIAKAFNTEVTGICSSQHIGLVESLGADTVIDYTQQDFTETGTQYDIIFDVVGNRSFPECKKCLNTNGVYVTTQPTPKALMTNLAAVFTPGKKAKTVILQANGDDLNYLTQLIEKGKLRTIIDRTYPLSQVSEAHRYSEEGHATGKIVIDVAS